MKLSTLISAAATVSLVAATPLASAAPAADAVFTVLDVEQFTGGNKTIAKRQTKFGTIQFFSGNSCDAGAGNVVNINDKDVACIGAPNRHSIRVQGCRASVSFFENGNCGGNPYTVGSFNAGSCTNINTGRPWGSSRVFCPYNQ